MYRNSIDRLCWGDFLMEEDWEQLSIDGLIADVDVLITDLDRRAAEENPISLNFGG